MNSLLTLVAGRPADRPRWMPQPHKGGAMARSAQPGPMNRRRFLGATAGAAAAMSLVPAAAYADDKHDHGGEPTVLPSHRGIILYTVRDVVTRTPDPASGLGGGFRYVFEQLSHMGYKQ